jgi:[ribosomal protein S5]-alanine N-acetyltransferase
MLQTPRLVMRPFLKSDYRDINEYMSALQTYRFERGEPQTLQETKKFCTEFVGKTGPGFWAAVLKENGKVIGQVSFFPEKAPDFLTWEIGYIFNPAFQNKGYATEAARAVIRYAFTELGAHRVVAHCSPENTPSWKVLENCGMRREGTEKKNFLIRNDANGNPVWLDSYQYAILEDEFKKVRPSL